jgi:hypothetical protein
MKKLYAAIFFTLISVIALSQGITNTGAVITISNGYFVTINGATGNYTNYSVAPGSNGNGQIDLSGNLVVQGDWTNNSSNNVFSGTPLTDGTITFSGTGAQEIKGATETAFENLVVNKTVNPLNLASTSAATSGNFTIISGTFSQSAGTNLKIAGNWTNTGTYTSGTGSVKFVGASGISGIATGGSGIGKSFYNLEIASLNDVTLGGDLQVNNNYTLTTSTGFNCTSFNLIVAGDFIHNGGTFNRGTGTVTLTGTGKTLSGSAATTFRNLNVNGTYTLTQPSITMAKTSSVGGDLTISGSLDAGSQAINLEGNLDNSGTFTPGTGTVAFTGNVNQYISGNNSFYNLTIDNAGSINGVDNLIVIHSPTTVNNLLALSKGIVLMDTATSNNILTFSTNGNTAHYGKFNSFVCGTVKKVFYITPPTPTIPESEFTFPTGGIRPSKVLWAPVKVSSFKGPNFTAEYNMVAAPANWNPGCMTGLLDHTSGRENWVLDGGTNNSSVITLYWKDALWSLINTPSELLVAHWNGAQWIDLGMASYTPAGGDGMSSIKANVPTTSYSPFTFGAKKGTNNPLPIQLTEFKGLCKGDSRDLTWKTASETNNDFFTIESSKNGLNWTFVAKVPGSGNSNIEKSYSFNDDTPGSVLYYRLTQTDFNGQFKTFDPIVVNCSDISEKSISIFPNPFQSLISVNLLNISDENITVNIYDMFGKLIEKSTYRISNGFNNMITLDMGDLPAAVYYLEVKATSFVKSTKIVKNK